MPKQPVIVTIKSAPIEIEGDVQKFLAALGYGGRYTSHVDHINGTATVTLLLDVEQHPWLPCGNWQITSVIYASGDRAALIAARLSGDDETAAAIEAAVAEQEQASLPAKPKDNEALMPHWSDKYDHGY